MVRETNNVCFGQIAQETQVVVREDNKRDHLKRSTEDVSPPNFTERNYERSSRLVADTDSYIRRSNSNNNTINNYQSSSNNNSASSNSDSSRSRTRDRLYRNGPYAATSGVSSATSSASIALSERTSSGGAASKHNNNSRVPPASWYEAAATYTNGPGGSGNADVSAANINNHYQTAASTDIQQAAAPTANSTTNPSAYTAYSYASSSPAHNSNTSLSSTTTSLSAAASSTSRNISAIYGNVSASAAGVVGGYHHNHQQQRDNDSTETPLLNKNKQKLFKSCSSLSRSGSASPTLSSAATASAGAATMTSSSTSAAVATSTSSSSSSSTSATNNNNNQTANNNSCSSISSTINSSNTNNNSLQSSSSTAGDNVSNVSGILNAAALAAAASNGSSSADGHQHKSSSSSNNNHPISSSNVATSSNSNNPSTSASHHSSRSAVHAHFHGRSTTSSSRSHSRSPSSYSSSHSSSSSSSSTASSHSHASSPVGGRDVETSSSTAQTTSRGSRSLQSAVAVPGTSSALNPGGSNACSSSSSSSSSTSSGTPSANPVVHSEDNRPLAIRVRNLPARSSDTSLKDGLFHEYKKHGKVTWVKVVGQNAERYALVCFKKPEDVEKALEVSHDKLFFGCKIEVEPYQGYDVEDNEFRPYEAELDEYHPKSTRTLFIGNLEKEITASELRLHFECFGEIIEIDIKKQGMSAYAFCQYSDIVSVVKAMRKMDGEHLGNNRIKLGFGKSMPTNCVWIDGIGEKISESHLQSQFSRYGAVSKVVVDRQKQLALVLYEQIQYAQTAVKEMRGATLRGRKLQVDFASRECQDAFYEKLEKQTAGSRFNRYESQSRSRASSFSRHQNSNDGCSPSNTPGSSSSSSAGILSSAPTISSAIVAGSSINSSSNNTSGGGATLPSVVGQTSGNTTPARSRGSRSSRHTMDYDYIDTRRFRSYDEYSQGSGASHDEDTTMSNHLASSSNTNSYSGIGLRSDSPLLSRLGPIVNSSGKESSSDMLEMALSRRRCDKSPAKQKGDVRLFQKERAVLLEQLEECPSSGDESIVSPRKRIKIDHHSINSSSGLSQSHSLEEQTQQNKNLNCDYPLNDSMHRKGEVRRLSECSTTLNKYQQQANHHHHPHHAINPHHHHHQQQQLSRRPSIDFMATGGGGGSGAVGGGGNSSAGGGNGSSSARHGSTSSSNSDHHPPPHQPSSLACKRRRIIASSSGTALSTNALLSSSTGGSGGVSANVGAFGNDDFHHHASRGRGHQLHSHHSHEASGGESADGSRPGTPLCDERPEVLPSEPRRVPRERPREPMVLPLPKFGIQFFQQYRNSAAGSLNITSTSSYHHHNSSGVACNSSSGFASSSAAVGSTNSGSSHMLSNSLMNRGGGVGEVGIISNHSSLSHSSATATTSSAATASGMPIGSSSAGGCYLPSPSTRYQPWRPHHHHHHHHHHGVSGSGGHHGGAATPSSSSSMVSPMRSRSLSSNSSDSDMTGQATGSPSLEERIRTLDEMYERWSGGSSSTSATGSNVVKRHDFSNTPPTWQHHRSTSQTDLHHTTTAAAAITTTTITTATNDPRSSAPPTPASRPKFLDIDVKEIQPSEIVKSVLAKKSIFDDDLQRLKKNHWYEPSTDSSQVVKNVVGVCTSPGLPNLQATKTPVVGCTTPLPTATAASLCSGSSVNKPSGALLQRLTSLSPMNSPQASMSPYNSPSMSPSVNSVTTLSTLNTKSINTTSNCGTTMASPSPVYSTAGAGTSPASSGGGSKCLQYPFPTHPPLPNTAAPLPNNQPIPPPPAENLKPSVAQPPLPPMEVHQPPQPPPVVTTTSTPATVSVISKPKTTSALSKSLSVPPTTGTTSASAETTRVLTKSVSVPGSTNVGTVKTAATPVSTDQKQQPQQMQTGNSSSTDSITKTVSSTVTTSNVSSSEATVKQRSEKSHKHNHRSSEDKKSSKSDKRKNSNSSQSQMSQASAAESSDADDRDLEHRKDRETRSEKQQKERHDKREKELRKQQEREERERDREREREERDKRDREARERLENERLEKERLEKVRLEKERLELEEQEKLQREKERLRREEENAREERERKEREENERKLKEQREREEREGREREERDRREREERERKELEERERKEREERERKEREERERKEREERERKERDEHEERLRKERKEREENEQLEKERIERQRSREEKDRERKSQEESSVEQKRDIHLLKEHQRRKDSATASSTQHQAKSISNDTSTSSNQAAQDFFRQGETERHNNKENSTEESMSVSESASAGSSGKHRNRKTSRNTSPVRHPKRRLSSQDSNASNSGGNNTGITLPHGEEHIKRMRIDSQTVHNPTQLNVNNHSATINNVVNERRETKEHHSKDKGSKHNRLPSSSSSHKAIMVSSIEKDHSTKHHRNKHHHKQQQSHNNPNSGESSEITASKSEAEVVTTNCLNKIEGDRSTEHDMEVAKSKSTPLLSSEDEDVSENQLSTQNTNKTPSGGHKHKEHVSGHHSRHKSSKRDRDHHREKKRHSTSAASAPAPVVTSTTTESVPSTPPINTIRNVEADEDAMSATEGQPVVQRRTSGHNSSNLDTQPTAKAVKRDPSAERKLSRCSEEMNANQQPQTPSSRMNSSYNKSTPQSGSRKMLLSSAEDTDGGGGLGCDDDDDDSDAVNRKHSIFDIPDEGPYVSMYDKVKARSCKNMQKQEEEKKIKAKFSQLKQSRAKREEKKRSTSYDGDSDSEGTGTDTQHHRSNHSRSGGSYKMLSGALTSTDDEQDRETGKSPIEDRRRNSQASSSAASNHPHRLCSDSDDNSEIQRRLKLKDNILRLCDVDDSSDDDLIRRNNSNIANKRLLHHSSRIASDSESQSQSATDIKLKQEPIDTTSNDDGTSTPILKHLKHKIKKEIDTTETASGAVVESSDFDEIKLKHLTSLQSSTDEAAMIATIKTEADLMTVNEIKKEYKEFYAEDDYMGETEEKLQKSPAMASASLHCSPEQAKIKKHKKSKRRQKTPTQDTMVKDQIASADTTLKHSPTTNTDIADNALTSSSAGTQTNVKNAKHLQTSPSYDVFDELKNADISATTNATADTHAVTAATGEKKRHRDRKEKKREKLRHMSADIGQGSEMDKLYEKEKHHRLKKSKKSKSMDVTRQNSTQSTTSVLNIQMSAGTSPVGGGFTPQHKQRSGGEKMEDIFGPISDEEEDDMTDSDIAGRDLNCLPNRNASSSNVTGPIVSAALNPYKQEPLTPKSHTVEENEENKQKCPTLIGAPSHLERTVERQHRKEKREKKRKDREKSRGGAASTEQNQPSTQFMPTPAVAVTASKPLEDENSVDLDAAGRALEAQLMEDSDNKTTEDATPSTATTYRSDMTDVFRFSDGDENSLEVGPVSKQLDKDSEKEHTASNSSKTKKKKKKRSKEEKQLHHQQRRESSSSNASQQAACGTAQTPSCSNSLASKLTVDIQAANKHALKSTTEEQQSTTSPLCKPSPSLPCLIGEDDEEMAVTTTPTLATPKTTTPNTSLTCTTACTTPHRSSSKDLLSLSPHMRDKQMISPIPKTPTISNNSGLSSTENLKKLTPTTPTSSVMDSAVLSTTPPITTTPTSSTGNAAAVVANSLNKSTESTTSSATSNTMTSPTSIPTTQKKKPDIFIPGFDGEIDDKISESAVQSISAEFNTPLDPTADEPKIPVESPPDASKLEKIEESKSRVTISQEETESAVSALLGESFGNSSGDYSFNDDDDVALEDLNAVNSEPEPAMASAEPDEEAALAAKAIECEVESNTIPDVVEEDSEEVCKAIQSLRQEELEIGKADTPQSLRDLQIDTDTEENADEADSSGSHSLKIDETAQSNNSSSISEKANTTNSMADELLEAAANAAAKTQQQQSSVITKVEPPIKLSIAQSTEPKIEPPTITKQDQPSVQPVQSVIPTTSVVSVDLSLPSAITSIASSTIVSSMTSTSPAIVSMSCTSTPIKTALTFAPSTSTSSTPKQVPASQTTTVKPSLSVSHGSISAAYAMQPPTITIPEPTPPHFVVPQLVLSPRGVVTSTTTLNDSSSSSCSSVSIHSPQSTSGGHHHMPPQSPLSAAYMMGMRAQSPHSPRNTSRGNTPTPRQQSPHTPTPPPPVVVVTAQQHQQQQQQQQNILIQRAAVHQQQTMVSPNTHVAGSQINSPVSSPSNTHSPRPQQLVATLPPGSMQKISQQHSPGTPEQHMIKINNYSTPPSQTANVVNIRIPSQSPQHGQQQPSPQQQQSSHVTGKTVIEQHSVPIGQHILPISVQKMPPVPTHPTIISKVVTVTPQQAQQSTTIQQSTGGQQQSPKSAVYSPPVSRQSPQIIQQMGKTLVQQQQQNAQIHMIQQQQQRQQQQQQQRQQMQQHMQMQMQHQQMMHQQHQKLQQSMPQQQHHASYAASQHQSRGSITSPQQQTSAQQQHTQAPQQPSIHQQQLKTPYQHQQQLLAGSSSSPSQHSPTQQANLIQTPSSTPQRFLVQQHIVGIPAHMQPAQQQQQAATAVAQHQQRSSPNMQQHQQQVLPLYAKSQPQQGQLQSQSQMLNQQSPTQQRVAAISSPRQETTTNLNTTNETPSRVIVSTTQPQQALIPAPCKDLSPTGDNVNLLDKQQALKPTEGVSVIRTPTPTTTMASVTVTTTTNIVTPTPPITKETSPTALAAQGTSAANSIPTRPSAPLTEENVIKISPPKQDEIEQDSKEDSDYWSAKELNVVETSASNNPPISSQTNTSVSAASSSTVIKKNEAVSGTTSNTVATTNKIPSTVTKEVETRTSVAKQTVAPHSNELRTPNTKTVTTNSPSGGSVETSNMPSLDTTTNVAPTPTPTAPPTPVYNLSSGNVTTDHDTEDETETQQMPAFEQVSVQGRPNTRGTGAKRGRQPRGGKKAATASANPMVNQQAQDMVATTTGVQTRLRKPNATTPATRGRKGRPPRNLLLQQQQQQDSQIQNTMPTLQVSATNVSTAATPVLTAAEKKVRSQAAAAAATLASLSEVHKQQPDVYEFHDDSGEESKSSQVATATTASVTSSGGDSRPRLILTIKSPHHSTPLVKATEKVSTDNQQLATTSAAAETQQPQQDAPPTGNQISDSSTTCVGGDLSAMANTRKSRRLLEKDRSTIDDIIEDVVRNTAVPGGAAAAPSSAPSPAANLLTNVLPKGAQTPPRRSGRNSSSSSSQPKAKSGEVSAAIPSAANPIGRPRKSKDRKSITDLDNEPPVASPQAKPIVHEIIDLDDIKTMDDTPNTNTPETESISQQTKSAPPQITAATTAPTPQATVQTIIPAPSVPNTSTATIPQHPKKKALAAAEIESYQQQTNTPNIHSALPAGGVPMLNTAAPATHKTTGGAADSVNKPLIDPVTGIVSGQQMQQAKAGNLPSATAAAAAQPARTLQDPKKMMLAAVAAAAAESNVVGNKTSPTSAVQGSIATPITALTKPVQAETAVAAATTVTTGLLNKSVSVVVKTSTIPPTPPTSTAVVMQQQIQITPASQQPQQQQHQSRVDVSTPTKQQIIMQQQVPLVMHAQHSNVRPPTSLKAHVLNSQKLQHHPQQQQMNVVTTTPISQPHQQLQQQQQHQQLQPQQQHQPKQSPHHLLHQPGGTQQTSSGHVIQSSIVVQRQTPPQTQMQSTKQQLLVNIPPPTQHSPQPTAAAATNALNSPRLQHTQHQQQQAVMQPQQQQPIIIKQGQELHQSQILHVVSSKAPAPPTPNKTAMAPSSATHVHHMQQPQATQPFNPYIQQAQTSSAQQHGATPHQPTMSVPQKTTTSSLVLPPGLMGLPTHPSMVIQTKTSGPSPSGSATNMTHLHSHPSHHNPSPPLQQVQQHLAKAPSNPMLHSLQTQGVARVLNAVSSPPPSAAKPSTMTTNVVAGGSNLRTAVPTISPQSQTRMGPILLPGGMQVPPHFEANMSEASFPGGPIRGVPTREHLMIYQQLLRQHDPLNPATLREYDEKLMGSSPPLELRRPGSVPRTVAVPHSLQSPQDRATDSPQVAQVYVHNTRIPAHSHYDVTGRAPAAGVPPPSAYYDPARQMTLEPPPAHRSVAPHSVVAPPPPSVVVPHPSSASSSPFMPAAPPATAVQPVPLSGAPAAMHHPKQLLEREREQRERERGQHLMREKEQILVRAGDGHNMQVASVPSSSTHQLPPQHAQGPPPPQADSLLTLLQRYPVMWQGLLALKTDQAAVQMHFVFGNPHVARASLPCNSDGSTPPLRIAQRMRLEQTQLEGVAKKMQFENEHCMLLALPCGRDHADVLQQSRNLQSGFITYLQQKMAAGIVNIPMPGSEQAAYVVHIFPSCDFANENLEKAAPDLKNRVADIAHLLIVIATV